ncbi:MAG: site-2 protease family protein [Chloroflexi bacterium]|nr:site-2 protease family protein [Chloroflexota bacterium]
MRSSLSLGKIFGIPVGIHYSWLVIFFIVTLSLSLYYFPSRYPFWSEPTYWVIGISTSLLFFTSVVTHELAHSAVAINKGIPVKSITLFIFGGVSHIAREATHPSTELVMAMAGPLSSLGLGVFFGALWLITHPFSEPLAALAYWLAIINVSLAFFNLIPGFPLDGGRVLRSIIWGITENYRRSTQIASWAGQAIAYLFILGGVIIIFSGGFVNGIWLAFIGWFLNNAASASYHQAVLRDVLQGFTAQDVMSRNYSIVPPELTLGELVRSHVLRSDGRSFLVVENGQLAGMVTLSDIRGVSRGRWDLTSVSEAMTPIQKLTLINPQENALTVLDQLEEKGYTTQMPVVEEGRLVGIIGREDVLRFIRVHSELGM